MHAADIVRCQCYCMSQMPFSSTLSLGEPLTVRAFYFASMNINTHLLWITAGPLCSDTYVWCVLQMHPYISICEI